METISHNEYPRRADLRKDVIKPLPNIPPGTVDPASMTGDESTTRAKAVLEALNAALASKDAGGLIGCFHGEQAYWRDQIALTSHFRTFTQPSVIASALLEMVELRGLEGSIEAVGEEQFVVVSPVTMFIDCSISFRTTSPALICTGRLALLPVKIDGSLSWKIWILSTYVENLVHNPEDESLLRSPGRTFDGVNTIETEVCILGGGTAGLMTAARLKTLGVESVILDRNARVGNVWANRYDSLTIHVPTSTCELPYLRFKQELQSPNLLTKNDIAEQLHNYAQEFNLNVILEAVVQSTVYDPSEKKWTLKFKTGGGDIKTIVSKHFVQATGLGCGKPYIPEIKDEHLYKGLSIHSVHYRNAQVDLVAKGVKSVAVIGSANTAFDVMQDTYKAGLKTTIVARSPTYMIPYDYVTDPRGFGMFDVLPLEVADRLISTFPLGVDSQFTHGLFAYLASQGGEPDRYIALQDAGFPVLDSTDPSANLQHYLIERGGGHYVDVGGTELIAESKVAVRGLLEPVGYTETGLRMSDGSTLDVDAVMWCTGFADLDVKKNVRDMLGGSDESAKNGENGVLGPVDIAERLDATWAVDAEGEVRGMAKRHLRMENYWVIGGAILHQRWWSRLLAQQIRLALDGKLPPAYRETPTPE